MTDTNTGEITARNSLGRLTELSKQIDSLIAQSDVPPEELTKALDQVNAQWLTKIESIGHLVKDYEHMIVDFEEERQRLDNMSKALKLRVEWLKQYLMFNMQAKGEDKLQFSLVTVSVRNNPPSVGIADETEIPASYTRIIQEIRIDKASILKELKDGKTVRGCFLITDKKRLEVK